MTTEQNLQPGGNQASPEDDDINLLDLLIVLAKHKKKIILVPLLAALVTAGGSLLMPNIYTATTKFFPPQGSQSAGSALLSQIGGQLGALGGLAGGALGIKNPADMYIAFLQSRPVEERLIQKFDLQKKREHKFAADTRNYLNEVVSIASGKDGVITVEVDNEDPKLAADMANFYLDELKRIISSNAVTEAAQRRQFFETELKPARDKLTDAQANFDRTPASSLRYLDAAREMKYREALWEVLVRQYESARLDEAKDAVYIQVVETAVAPEKKSKPKRALMVVMAGIFSGFIMVLWAFVNEAADKAKSAPLFAERWNTAMQYLRWRQGNRKRSE